ncbi:MAG: nucleoside recognition domain-containing protein [Evtepia gabavorous]
MQLVLDLLVPGIIAGSPAMAWQNGVDVYDALLQGAAKGLEILLRILPALVTLLTVVAMLRASGALELAAELLAPALEWLGIPPETVGLMLVRPISGSAALGVGSELITTYGPDSTIGRTAAVMLGSTETTFIPLRCISAQRGSRKPGMRCRRPSVPIWRAFSLPPLRCGCFWDNSGIGDGQGGFARGWLCVIMQESPMRGERERVGRKRGAVALRFTAVPGKEAPLWRNGRCTPP